MSAKVGTVGLMARRSLLEIQRPPLKALVRALLGRIFRLLSPGAPTNTRRAARARLSNVGPAAQGV
jgi:hypothetical protein